MKQKISKKEFERLLAMSDSDLVDKESCSFEVYLVILAMHRVERDNKAIGRLERKRELDQEDLECRLKYIEIIDDESFDDILLNSEGAM